MKHLALLALTATLLPGQERFLYPLPSDEISISHDVEFGPDLRLDLYKLAGAARGAKLPVLVFANSIGGGAIERGWPIYQGWARLAAARGFGAIVMDGRENRAEEDLDLLLGFLEKHGAEHGLDGARVALYAASANVWRAFALVEDPKRSAVKAALIFYGTAEVTRFRQDLPVLLVRAGLDRPDMNRQLDAMAAAALSSNAPVRVLNHASGHHGFEVIDDTDETRAVIDEALRFAQTSLGSGYQASLRATAREATAAGAILRGDFALAANEYGALVPSRPNDIRLLMSYGEALTGAGEYKKALAQFDRVKEIGGAGPRDLGIPAARAAALDRNSEAALRWLQSIPARFRPTALSADPAFAAMRSQKAFQDLFPGMTK
ncbi:MAG: hypothetical protein ABI693_09920 [Bryobacteraceae bacterium]